MISPAAIFGQILLALFFAAECEDRIHRERALHRGEGAHAGVAALQLLHDEPVRDVVEPGASVLLREIGAEDAERRHFGHELLREFSFDVAVADDREHALVDETPDAVADGALFLGELGINRKEIEHVESY